MEIYEIRRLYNVEGVEKSYILKAYEDFAAEKGVEACKDELVFVAADHVHTEALKALIELGIDPAIADQYDNTLLHHAAKMVGAYHYDPTSIHAEDIENTVNLLLDHKVSALKKDADGRMTCYHYAARRGNYRFVETLAKRGVKLSFTDKDGNTGIHIAAEYVKRETSSLDYAKKAVDFQKERGDGGKSLEINIQKVKDAEARIEEYFKTVKAFAENGADISEKNAYGKSALDFAVQNNAKKIAAYLSGALGGDCDEEAIAAGGMTLYQAADKGDAIAIKAIVKRGADVNGLCAKEEFNGYAEGWTALAVACNRLDLEAVETLLECGANPSFKNSSGLAAISRCINPQVPSQEIYFKRNLPNIIKSVVKAGFNVDDFVDDELNTILNLACKAKNYASYGRSSTKEILIDEALSLNADINLANRFGETPLMNACGGDFTLMEKYQLAFLENGADVNAADKNGDRALHYAARNVSQNGAKTFCDMLLEFGADVNAVNNQGKRALDIATDKGNEPLVKLLLSKI
jgi:ankyrin repeat protein